MNKVHTWKVSLQIEAHLTSSPVFLTPLGRSPNQDLFSPKTLSRLLSSFIFSQTFYLPLIFRICLPTLTKNQALRHEDQKELSKEPPPSNSLVVHWSASMVCPTILPTATRLLQLASSPQLPGCLSHLARIHGKRGGSPSHFKKITKLHSNSPKALLNILQQVSPPHCISNPLPDSLTTQPGSSIWLLTNEKNKPHMGSTGIFCFHFITNANNHLFIIIIK